MSSSLPYFEVKVESGKTLKFLVDTGSSKNYVKPELVKKRIPNETPFYAKSIAGEIKIIEHTYAQFFNVKDKVNYI